MMKKLVLLTLVLGMASLANAGLELSPVTATANPSDMVGLSVVVDADGLADAADYRYLAIVVQGAEGTISGGSAAAGNLTADQLGNTISYFPLVAGEAGIDWYVGDSGGVSFAAGTTMIDSIDFHMLAEDPTPAVISLYASAGFASYEIVDTLTITPEPVTMALLGLGGLFLRRRK
ncbi:MAG: PEP-CTERM sorting domain-containing protein [Planctomycetes bacterium]|nr:PEP-CTERM sorting domain-containing protein [Planctomycetota bacterium]